MCTSLMFEVAYTELCVEHISISVLPANIPQEIQDKVVCPIIDY